MSSPSNMSLNLFIIGPSGCGKTTQAKLIAQKYGLTHLSTGNLFRKEIKNKTKIGLKVQSYVNRGIWVPDQIVVDFISKKLAKIGSKDFIVDGTPRRVGQAPLIQKYLRSIGQNITALIYLDVSFAEITKRRTKFGQEFQSNRVDTSASAVINRQNEHTKTIRPILNYFQKQHKLIKVDGNRPIQPIFNDICLKINNLSKKGK